MLNKVECRELSEERKRIKTMQHEYDRTKNIKKKEY